MSKEIEYDFSVDLNSLETEWAGQAKRHFDFTRELSVAQRGQDEAKAEFDVIKAELEMAVRSDPEKFGLAKVTEAAVTATVLTQEEYQKAQKATIQARYAVNVLEGAVKASDHRKKALEKEVELWLGGYYSAPRSPAGAREHLEDFSKQEVRNRGRRREMTNDTD